jgi:phosphoribosylformylglycinamidine cyclo-ligase
MESNESAYKKAGVDINAGAELVDRIKPLVKSTSRSGVLSNIGGFGALFDLKETGYKDPVLVSSTDGVGTKIKIAIEAGKHDTIGIDLVAMCVNDLIVQGAEPLFFMDYFACGKLDTNIAEEVISGIVEGCRMSNCALIGGETAEMPGMYAADDYDLAGFTVGAVERNNIVKSDLVEKGNIILGIASNGAHSNGYSLIRNIIENSNRFSYNDPAPFQPGATLAEAFLEPTRIYVPPILKALNEKDQNGHTAIKSIANITGGGLTENIPRSIPDNLSAIIDASSWELPPMFKWLREEGKINNHDMVKTFNCGIGMAVICDQNSVDTVKDHLENENDKLYVIGEVTENKNSANSYIKIEKLDKSWK